MIDERFKMHRWKSTSLAAIVGAVLLGGLWFWERFAHHFTRHDILIVLVAMAAVKLAAMLYYRRPAAPFWAGFADGLFMSFLVLSSVLSPRGLILRRRRLP